MAHLAEVAGYVADERFDPAAIAAAWLHDVVEDTSVTIADIAAEFGQEMALMIEALTDPSGWAMLPLSKRKPMQAARIKAQAGRVKIIKLADQISNVRSVLFDPPSDWESSKSQAYIAGALLVGRACAGSCLELDIILERYATEAQSVMEKTGTAFGGPIG